MKSKHWLFWAVFSFAAVDVSAQQLDEAQAVAYVQQLVSHAQALQAREGFCILTSQNIDLAAFARAIVPAEFWGATNAVDQAEFTKVAHKMLSQKFHETFKDYAGGNFEVDSKNKRKVGAALLVPVKITPVKGAVENVEFIVAAKTSGSRVDDINLRSKGVSVKGFIKSLLKNQYFMNLTPGEETAVRSVTNSLNAVYPGQCPVAP